MKLTNLTSYPTGQLRLLLDFAMPNDVRKYNNSSITFKYRNSRSPQLEGFCEKRRKITIWIRKDDSPEWNRSKFAVLGYRLKTREEVILFVIAHEFWHTQAAGEPPNAYWFDYIFGNVFGGRDIHNERKADRYGLMIVKEWRKYGLGGSQ
jgi:hypothetical protein